MKIEKVLIHKFVTGREKIEVNEYMSYEKLTSRGHSRKMFKKSGEKDARKFSFPNSSVDQWKAVPNEVVCQSNSQIYGHLWQNE